MEFKTLRGIVLLGALALAGCSDSYKNNVDVYSQNRQIECDEKETKIKPRPDYMDKQEIIKESISLPSWRKVPF